MKRAILFCVFILSIAYVNAQPCKYADSSDSPDEFFALAGVLAFKNIIP